MIQNQSLMDNGYIKISNSLFFMTKFNNYKTA